MVCTVLDWTWADFQFDPYDILLTCYGGGKETRASKWPLARDKKVTLTLCYSMHLHDLGKIVKDAVKKQGMLGWQYNTIGVSDAITMGGEGV